MKYFERGICKIFSKGRIFSNILKGVNVKYFESANVGKILGKGIC